MWMVGNQWEDRMRRTGSMKRNRVICFLIIGAIAVFYAFSVCLIVLDAKNSDCDCVKTEMNLYEMIEGGYGESFLLNDDLDVLWLPEADMIIITHKEITWWIDLKN